MLEAVAVLTGFLVMALLAWDACNGFVLRWDIVAIVCGVVLGLAVIASPARAQHSGHPPQDQAIHERFYKDWMMPDNPSVSCCHERDCYPTEARKTANGWIAKRREDGKWLSVPDAKIERERENPDGRNHLCAPAPPYGEGVYCFILGGAT